jgi:hypothetical protein
MKEEEAHKVVSQENVQGEMLYQRYLEIEDIRE